MGNGDIQDIKEKGMSEKGMKNEVLKKLIEALEPLGYDIQSVNASTIYRNCLTVEILFPVEEKKD